MMFTPRVLEIVDRVGDAFVVDLKCRNIAKKGVPDPIDDRVRIVDGCGRSLTSAQGRWDSRV
jgi:hypothetical protein